MKPKEKAIELVKKYIEFKIDGRPRIFGIALSKQFALIAVDEIVKSKELNYLFTQEQIDSMEGTSDDRWIYETFMKYWKQVKKEIEKL